MVNWLIGDLDTKSQVTDTMAVYSSSVRVIARSNPSQFPPVLIHVACSCKKWISGNVHYICLHKQVNKAESTLALKHKDDITRIPKQAYQWP